jgi:hypothetical protein
VAVDGEPRLPFRAPQRTDGELPPPLGRARGDEGVVELDQGSARVEEDRVEERRRVDALLKP